MENKLDSLVSFDCGSNYFVRRPEDSGGGSWIRTKSKVLLCVVKQSISLIS